MQAVVLAGGLGTRLRPLTYQRPKVLVPVLGHPFLYWLLQMLKKQGISRVLLLIGYLREQIMGYCGDGRPWGLEIAYSHEEGPLLGTGGALRNALPYLEEHFFLLNGDTYLPLAYPEVEGIFLRRGAKALLVVYDNKEETGVKNNVALDQDLMVVGYSKAQGGPERGFVEAGVLALRRGVVELLPQGQSISIEAGLYPTLIRQRELAAYISPHRFYDMGTPPQLQALEAYLRGQGK